MVKLYRKEKETNKRTVDSEVVYNNLFIDICAFSL